MGRPKAQGVGKEKGEEKRRGNRKKKHKHLRVEEKRMWGGNEKRRKESVEKCGDVINYLGHQT